MSDGMTRRSGTRYIRELRPEEVDGYMQRLAAYLRAHPNSTATEAIEHISRVEKDGNEQH